MRLPSAGGRFDALSATIKITLLILLVSIIKSSFLTKVSPRGGRERGVEISHFRHLLADAWRLAGRHDNRGNATACGQLLQNDRFRRW